MIRLVPRLLLLIALAIPMAGCVVGVRPLPIRAGAVWVPGHYRGWRWVPAHWG